MKDLHILPRIRDGWTFLYVEHAKIDKQDKAIVLHTRRARWPCLAQPCPPFCSAPVHP